MSLAERSRLAQELHDGIAQDLVGVSYSLDLLLSDASTPLETRIAVRKVRLDVIELLDKIRTEIHDLHQINEASFQDQLRTTTENICSGLALDFVETATPLETSDEVSYQVIRIVRELLRNIIKHAEATKIVLTISADSETALIVIHDDGQRSPAHSSGSFGLTGSAGRAHAIGGTLIWKPDASGSTATLRFPRLQKSL